MELCKSSDLDPNNVKSDELPEWMTIEFFQDIFKKAHPSTQGHVRNINVSYATKSGDNFASILYRAKLIIGKENEEIYPVIVKALPDLGLADDLIKSFNVFPKEIEMYAEIIPNFEAIYREFGEIVQFAPKHLKSVNTPTDILVLEDLSAMGYKMVDRQKGLDMQHTQIILEKLAKFHAASAVYHERQGPYSDKFDEGMYARSSRESFEPMMNDHFEAVIAALRSWSFGGEYVEKFQSWKGKLFSSMTEAVERTENTFNVLLHGDLWCNNAMFRYGDDNNIEEAMLIDFQLGFWGSPVIDFYSLIMSSVNSEIRLPKFDYFVKYYHDKLTENLKLLRYKQKLPTLKELQMEMLKRGALGVMTVVSVLPTCLIDPTEEASMDVMMRTDEIGTAYKHKLYNHPQFVNEMKDLLPFFDQKGLLEFS